MRFQLQSAITLDRLSMTLVAPISAPTLMNDYTSIIKMDTTLYYPRKLAGIFAINGIPPHWIYIYNAHYRTQSHHQS